MNRRRAYHALLAAVGCAVPERPASALAAAHAASYIFTTINAPNAIDTVATGINTRRQVVGEYTEDTPLQPTYGFLFDDSVFTILSVSSALQTVAFGINDGGQIVGYYIDGSNGFHGFLYDRGVFTTLDVPGATATIAKGSTLRARSWGPTSMASKVMAFSMTGAGSPP